MKELVIDRKVWLRGEGTGKSKLLRVDDGKRCCVGIYLATLGAGDGDLRECALASEVRLPEKAGWLVNANGNDTQAAHALYRANDLDMPPGQNREQAVAALFAEHGIAVKFVGTTPKGGPR